MTLARPRSHRLAVALVAVAATATATVVLAPASPASAAKSASHKKAARAVHTKAGDARTVDLPKGLRPEGITTGRGKTLYVGSVTDGRIWAAKAGTDKGRQLVAPVEGRSLRGLHYDKRTKLIWAAGAEGTTGAVLAFSARTGALKHSIAVPDAAFLNDLAYAKGSLWVTDSQLQRLVRVKLHRGHPVGGYSTLALSGDWPTVSGFGANGIVAVKGRLLLNNSTAGGLYAVSPKTGAAKALTIKGSPAVVSGDGMVRRGSRLYVVRGAGDNSITELALKSSHRTLKAKVLRTLTDSTLDVPSTATFAGGRLWAVNARFGVADPDTASYWVTGLSVRAKHRHHR